MLVTYVFFDLSGKPLSTVHLFHLINLWGLILAFRHRGPPQAIIAFRNRWFCKFKLLLDNKILQIRAPSSVIQFEAFLNTQIMIKLAIPFLLKTMSHINVTSWCCTCFKLGLWSILWLGFFQKYLFLL